MAPRNIIIIGAGIAGLASALALTDFDYSISIFEIRSEPATIGGSINLTPNALRYLDHLDVLPRLLVSGCEVRHIDVMALRTGQRLGQVNFDNIEKFKHRAMRIMRNDLLQALLETAEEKGVIVRYGMKIESVAEDSDGITAKFEDGTVVRGDILLGCDGIHSAVRMKFVQPSRKPIYSGIAVAYGVLDVEFRERLGFDATAIYLGRYGSFLMSYTDRDKMQLYVAAVMGTKDVGSREGWAVKGKDQEALRRDMVRRFEGKSLPYLAEMIGRVEEFVLYPVYKLKKGGSWSEGRVLLLGDAAHAVPPNGESTGYALEDAVLFSRVLSERSGAPVTDLIREYECLRRPRIDAAAKEANMRWETTTDRGWLLTILTEWMTWLFLLWTAKRKEQEFAFDVRDVELSLART